MNLPQRLSLLYVFHSLLIDRVTLSREETCGLDLGRVGNRELGKLRRHSLHRNSLVAG